MSSSEEKYPSTRPKRTNDVTAEIAQGQELTKPPSEGFVQAQIRARREAEAKNAGLTLEQVEALEAEKAAYIDAATLPPKRLPIVEISALPKRATVVDAAAVAAKLAQAEDELRQAQDEVAAAEAEAKKQEESRGFVIEQARQRLGTMQTEQAAVEKQKVEADLHDRARRLQESEIENKGLRSTEDEVRYQSFTRVATPLVAKLEAFHAELTEFSKQNIPALNILAATTWEKTPARWRTQDRQAYADRAARPAQELSGSITRMLSQTEALIVQARQVIAGRAEPHTSLLGRLEQASKNWLGHYEKQLAVLNYEVQKIETRGEAFTKTGFIPTVTIRERNPARDTTPRAQVITNWDRDAK